MKSEEFERQIEDEKVEGWSVDKDGDERVVMVKRSYGGLGAHTLIFILTFWTFGLGNAAYASYEYFVNTDKKVVRDKSAAVASPSAE